MSTNEQHTPTPWRVTSINGWDAIAEDKYPENLICNIVFNNPENAAFIVKAVNSHEALEEMVKEYRGDLRHYLSEEQDPKRRAALERTIARCDNALSARTKETNS